MKHKNDNEFVSISFSRDEALILFDWLSRYNEKESNDFHNQAEERVLWDLEAILEKANEATLKGNYKEILSKAWENLIDETS